MVNQIAKALNDLVDDVTIPDIEKLVRKETHFDRVGFAQTERHLEKHREVFTLHNYVLDDHDVSIQDLLSVISFAGEVYPNRIREQYGWRVRTCYDIHFIQAPCLIINKSRIRPLLLPHVPLSDDATPNAAGQLLRLNVPMQTFWERLAEEDCSDDVWNRFIQGDLSMITVMFKPADDTFIATPLTSYRGTLPSIDNFTFDPSS